MNSAPNPAEAGCGCVLTPLVAILFLIGYSEEDNSILIFGYLVLMISIILLVVMPSRHKSHRQDEEKEESVTSDR